MKDKDMEEEEEIEGVEKGTAERVSRNGRGEEEEKMKHKRWRRMANRREN